MTVTANNGLLAARGEWANATCQESHQAQQILILNLMPTKVTTERQFLKRFAAGNTDVAVTFMYPASHHFKSLPQAVVAAHYVTLADIQDQYFDGLIVTARQLRRYRLKQSITGTNC
nr:homoserine O-succinyltransferase [Lactiplantibacillus plantarum]